MKNLITIFFLFAILAKISYSQNLDSGLVGKWLFSGNALDSSGNGNHGTVYGATLTTDRFGNANKAYSFDGVNDYIQTLNSTSLSIVGDITMAAWVYDNGPSNFYHTILNKRLNGSWNYGMSLCFQGGLNYTNHIISGRRNYNGVQTQYLYSNDTVDFLSWQHLVVTIKNDTIHFYKNGIDAGHNPGGNVFTIPMVNPEIGVTFGCAYDATLHEWMSGKLDDIGIWNRALTQAEITALYNNSPVLLSPTLISPSNNSFELPLTPTLVWTTVSGVIGYKVKISNDSTFASVTDSATVTTNQYAVASGKLNYNTKYYWKIAGYNTYGTGQYSTTWNFSTLNPLPLQVTLISPSNGSNNLTLTPTLFWNTSTNSTGYRVQVSPTNTFSFIVDSATVTTNQRTIPAGKLNIATTYYWKVQGVNNFGNGPWSDTWNFFTVISGINPLGTEIPKEYKMYENYPNPFNPTTKIRFDLPKTSHTSLSIYDITGKEVEMLVNENLSAGKYELQWNGNGKSSGVYFYKIQANDFTDIKRMILIK